MGSWGAQMWADHMSGDHMFWGWLLLTVVVVLILWLVGARTGGWPGGPASGPPRKSAMDILKERYARGEIGAEEFAQKKRDLEDS